MVATQQNGGGVPPMLDGMQRESIRQFRIKAAEGLHKAVLELSEHLASDLRIQAWVDAAPGVAARMPAFAQYWLDRVFDAAERGGPSPHDTASAAVELARIAPDRLVGGLARVRRRLVELVLAEGADATRLGAKLEALQLAVDEQCEWVMVQQRQSLSERERDNQRLAVLGQLVAGIGHELRNPLNIIETSAYLLMQRLASRAIEEPSVGNHLDKIRNQVRLASRIVENLLGMAKDRPPNRTSLNLRRLVETSLEGMRCPPEVQIVVELNDRLEAWADPEQLRIVIGNLVANALDAVGARGTITVGAAERDGGVMLSVVDDGPGIAEADRTRIFEALHSTKPQGHGLGLALSKKVAVAHGGDLQLLPSEKGAVFHFWLPNRGSRDEATG